MEVTRTRADPFSITMSDAPDETALQGRASVNESTFVPFGPASTAYHNSEEVGGVPAQRLDEVTLATALISVMKSPS